MNKVIGYDISKVEGEHFLQTHSTNPLLTAGTLEQAIKRYSTIFITIIFIILFVIICIQAFYWLFANSATPHVMGMPFGMFFIALFIGIEFAVLVIVYFLEAKDTNEGGDA